MFGFGRTHSDDPTGHYCVYVRLHIGAARGKQQPEAKPKTEKTLVYKKGVLITGALFFIFFRKDEF